MLDPILLTLATTAGSHLATAMIGDGWTEAKALFARFFGRGDPVEEARYEERLERTRDELTAGGTDAAQQRQEAAWTARFEDMLEAAPQLADPLRELLQHLETRASAATAGTVQVNAQAGDQAQQAVQGQGVQTNTFGARED